MLPSLVDLAARVLGKHFLAIESFRHIPEEIVEIILDEYLKTISSFSIINENDLTRIVHLLSDHHSDRFCTSFRYAITNHLNLLSTHFYHRLLERVHDHLVQLDFSNAFEKMAPEERNRFLNLIGQMENLEYLRLTFNRLDDDDIRMLTASNRIKSKALCNLHTLHLYGKIPRQLTLLVLCPKYARWLFSRQ